MGGDVILKYSADEARSLKAYGELPESAKINETDTYGGEEEGGIGFDFGEDDDDSSSGGEGDRVFFVWAMRFGSTFFPALTSRPLLPSSATWRPDGWDKTREGRRSGHKCAPCKQAQKIGSGVCPTLSCFYFSRRGGDVYEVDGFYEEKVPSHY